MDMPEQIKPYFRFMGYLSIGVLFVDMLLSAMFGLNIGLLAAAVMTLISLGSGILLVVAAYLHCVGQRQISYVLCAVWVPMFAFNIMSNMGVATASRMEDVQKAVLQQARFKEVENSKRETATELAVLKKAREALKAKFASLVAKKVGDWDVTTLPAETPTLDKLIAEKTAERDRESKRNGCAQKCEARTAELSHLVALRGVAAQIEDTKQRIAIAEKGLDTRREQLAGTEAGLSQTANQATLYVKMFNLASLNGWKTSDNPEALNAANELMGVFMAVVLAVASAGLSIASVWPSLAQVRSRNLPAPTINLQAIDVSPKHDVANRIEFVQRVQPVTTVGNLNLERLRRIAGQAA